jgi:ATP-dependent helicase HrpB
LTTTFSHIDLPIQHCIPDLLNALKNTSTVLVSAPPGAGKSTLLPLTLLNENWLDGKKIILLEPRRIAAKTIAARMAELLGEEVGQTVGYRIKLETRIGKNTRLEVVTEGILTRMLQSNSELTDVGIVLFDEFHERSIHADLSLALCREAQQIVRPDLRIVVMSATMQLERLSKLLNAPVISSQGRQFPISIHHTNDTDPFSIPEMTAELVKTVISKHEGDVLVFLPGEGEIRKCAELLSKNASVREMSIHPLYGMLPLNQQMAALLPHKEGKRKIVLATSIAETSLTIEGIKIVVDSGYSKTQRFDSRSGLSRLETVTISQDIADQRAGRSGRLSEGVCYRMWSKATHARLKEHRTPEILEADLCSLVLDLKKWGVQNISDLTWLDCPPAGAVHAAIETLEQLEALEGNKITKHGIALHQLPCHPRIAHMLVKANEMGLVSLAADIASIIEERDPMRDAGCDITLRIEQLRKQRQCNSYERSFKRISQNAQYYLELLTALANNEPFDPTDAGLLISFAFPERIAGARPGNNAQFQLANGRLAMFSHKDDLANEQWLAVAHVDARDGIGKIFLAAPLNPKDLAPLVKRITQVSWDTKKGGLIAQEEWRIGSILLQTKPIQNIDPALKAQGVCNSITKEGLQLLQPDERTLQLMNRVASLRIWDTQHSWPEFDALSLQKNCHQWLTPYLDKVRRTEDLQKLPLYTILYNSLDWELQQALDSLAPEKVTVPSGSAILLHYHMNGQPPSLSVRLQELFGLLKTPTVCNEAITVVIHLLSPGYKPVQVTADLQSFWQNAYHEVKKELKRRYPKHSWPDNPLEAIAVKGVQRKPAAQ